MNLQTRLAGPFFIVPLLICGCSGSTAIPTGRVIGTVMLDGKALDKGRVMFSSTELGVAAMADVNPDGSYEVEIPLRLGEYRAAVAGPAGVNPNWVPGEPLPPPPPTPIPKKYWDVNTSGLAYTVKKGSNQIDIQIAR